MKACENIQIFKSFCREEKINIMKRFSLFFFSNWKNSVFRDTSALSQISNCHGVVLEICLDHKFQ